MVNKPNKKINPLVKGVIFGVAIYAGLQGALHLGSTVSKQEAASPLIERVDRIFEKYDSNRDGKLSRYEIRNLVEDRQEGECEK